MLSVSSSGRLSKVQNIADYGTLFLNAPHVGDPFQVGFSTFLAVGGEFDNVVTLLSINTALLQKSREGFIS